MKKYKMDKEYFKLFGENLTDKQKELLKGTFGYQTFILSKANEEFVNSLKNTWIFNELYNILNKLIT